MASRADWDACRELDDLFTAFKEQIIDFDKRLLKVEQAQDTDRNAVSSPRRQASFDTQYEADAALGRLVRNMPPGMKLIKCLELIDGTPGPTGFNVITSDGCCHAETPEQAFKEIGHGISG